MIAFSSPRITRAAAPPPAANTHTHTHADRRALKTRGLKMLVIDEADEMLSRGFKEQIYDIYRYLPPATQVVLISATVRTPRARLQSPASRLSLRALLAQRRRARSRCTAPFLPATLFFQTNTHTTTTQQQQHQSNQRTNTTTAPRRCRARSSR